MSKKRDRADESESEEKEKCMKRDGDLKVSIGAPA